jgi:large subunit ribosomal protein L13
MSMNTVFAKKNEVERKWHIIDAEGIILGKLAAKVATVLRGKNKPIFTPNVDAGDFVIIINASKVRLTGKKLRQKMYYRHSGYPGGIKQTSALEMLQKTPERMIMLAVKGMLPKNRLGRALMKKLKVYAGSTHSHSAQTPKPLTIQ